MKKTETSTANTASDTAFSDIYLNYSFLGHGNKPCPLLSFCRDSPVNDILTQWKEHPSTGGKSQGLTQEDGIPLTLVPISNTSRERGKKSRRVAVTVMMLQLRALSTRAAHLTFCSNTVSQCSKSSLQDRPLWLCNFAWF